MHLDVVDLIEFYSRPLGHVAQRLLRQRLRRRWSDVRGLRVLGAGFATPYLRPFMAEAERVVACMPAGQGVTHWPLGERGLTALVEEDSLPFPDVFFDRVLWVHGVEMSEAVRPALRELWRVLAPEGRLIVVAPSRGSLWARAERTPFGHGRPFSRGQLTRLLETAQFEVKAVDRALYMPPFPWRGPLAAGRLWEEAGRRVWPPFSGVVILEARKRVHGMIRPPRGLRVPVRRPLPQGLRPVAGRCGAARESEGTG
jgi:SAM-dependent methyltransferase